MKKSSVRAVIACSFAALTLSVVAMGCGKSPKAFCKRLADLAAEQAKEKDKEKKMSDKDIAECEKDLAEIKEVSPKGYDCMMSCLDLKTAEATFVCVFTCSANDEKLKEHEQKKLEKKEDERIGKLVAKAKSKDKAFDGSIENYSGKPTKFTITLAEGYKEDDSSKSSKSYELKGSDDEPDGPHISVSSSLADDMESAAKDSSSTIIKKEKKDNGWIITKKGESNLDVEVVVASGEAKLECSAHVYVSKADKYKDDLLPWMEKMCSSLKPEFQENPAVLWTKLADKKLEGTLKTFDDKQTKFEITLGEGYKEGDFASDSMKMYELKTDGLETAPRFTVSNGYEEDVEAAAKPMGAGGAKITKKEKTENGWVIVTEGDDQATVKMLMKLGESKIECEGTVYSSKLKGHSDVVIPWLTKVCKSVKLK